MSTEEEEDCELLALIDAISRNQEEPIEIRVEKNGDITQIYQQASPL